MYKYGYMPTGYVGATSFQAAGLATAITASGLTAGAQQSSSVEGSLVMDDAADYILFYMALPELYFYGGEAADLTLSFDLSEGAAATGTDSYTFSLYELGNESTAMVSENLSMSATARAWVDTTGFGDNVSISGANKVVVVKINPQADTDDFTMYGARLKYRAGLDTTT